MSKTKKKIQLLQVASKSYLLISALLMILSSVGLYFYTKYLLQDEIEEELYSTHYRIEHRLSENKIFYNLPPVSEVEEVGELRPESLKDTIIYDPSQDEMEEFRELTSYKEINAKNYRITVRMLVVESKDILLAIVFSYIIILLLIFLTQFYFSKARDKILWAPFFTNLKRMKGFSLQSGYPIELVDSNILEFSELRQEIKGLMDKVTSDYQNLKQFTEDVSHELQTPLAIMQAKIENIINDQELDFALFQALSSFQNDMQRLVQLNKKLVLLTKLENKQFINAQELNFNELVNDTLLNFKELTPIPIELEEKKTVLLKADTHLIQVLCNNLISNAIKYCIPEGSVSILITEKSFSISNSGKTAALHPEKLFNRFYKEDKSMQSNGLGLAIVKKITDYYNYDIHYTFEDEKHIFKIEF